MPDAPEFHVFSKMFQPPAMEGPEAPCGLRAEPAFFREGSRRPAPGPAAEAVA